MEFYRDREVEIAERQKFILLEMKTAAPDRFAELEAEFFSLAEELYLLESF